MHSVTANIDLETRGKQCTFQKVSSQWRPKKKKRAIFKSICFNSMLGVMGTIIYYLVAYILSGAVSDHSGLRQGLPLQEPELICCKNSTQKEKEIT